MVAAALPPDVRKVSDLPTGLINFLGATPLSEGRSPKTHSRNRTVGQSHHRTSDGRAV